MVTSRNTMSSCFALKCGVQEVYKSSVGCAAQKDKDMAHPYVVPQQNNQRMYTAYFRHVTQADKEKFKHSKCIMPISVGGPMHYGERLRAALKLINRHFKECVILINDSIQWYSHAISNTCNTDEELYRNATLAGDEWIDSTRSYRDAELTIPYKMLRWKHWIDHKDFEYYLNKVIELYNNDNRYKMEIDANIQEFLCRLKKRQIKFEYDRGHKMSLRYLFEECASMCLWVEEKCEFQLYPHEINKSMRATFKYLLADQHSDLLKEAAYRIRSS